MARVKKIQEDHAADWQTIFCSLSIILVAFFVMLSSYATPQTGKMIEVKRSFSGALQIFSGGVMFEKGEGIVVPSPDSYGKMVEKIAAPIQQLLQGEGLTEQINLKSTNEYVSVTLLDTLLFSEGSERIRPEMQPVLAKLGDILGGYDVPIRIEGHTDDRVETGLAFGGNLELSALRGASVMRFFIAAGAISTDRLSVAGYGQYKPFVQNRTDEDRARNNRVEIIIPLVQEVFEKGDSIIRKAPPSFQVWDVQD